MPDYEQVPEATTRVRGTKTGTECEEKNVRYLIRVNGEWG